jgi:hypothetical protein
MAKFIKNRTPLSRAEVASFFEHTTGGHLDYRYTMLWRHKTAVDSNRRIEFGDAICAFECGLMECRVLMEFLGLGVRYDPRPILVEKQKYFSVDGISTDEIKVIDLGREFARISSLTGDEQRLLATVYYMAHKATAHLTFGAPHMQHPGVVHQCIPIVDRLLYENLYSIVGDKPRQHWQP